MANNVGELFKILSKNEIFETYLKEIENNKSNSEIIDMAVNNEELINILKNYVEDINIIKNKMDIIIGQKRKSYQKILEKNNKINDTELNNDNDEEEIIFKYLPINPENVVWLDKYNYIERVNNNMRLVNVNFECYY
jgi:transposase-like protein